MGRLNRSKGNMYHWVTHTWSPIQGCPHQCTYCYVRKYKELPEKVKLEKPFPNLGGEKKKIFVAHMGDLFAEGTSAMMIDEVLHHCREFSENEYVFQSKNTRRMFAMRHNLPKHSILGTTIETDDSDMLKTISKAPCVEDRAQFIGHLKDYCFRTFITIEPIMEFNVKNLFGLIEKAEPSFVNIGADSKGLAAIKEPSGNKIGELIQLLQSAEIEIRCKENLDRLVRS